MASRKLELSVGIFVILGLAAFMMLVVKVADFDISAGSDTYQLKAKFDNIGGLKPRSPVKVGGVIVGRVANITLDKSDFIPVVTLDINTEYNQLPETSTLSILTAGLLGEQYLGLEPGFIDEDIEILADGDFIEDTKSALVLEELIGQFLFSQSDD